AWSVSLSQPTENPGGLKGREHHTIEAMPQSLANVIVHAVFSTKHRAPTIHGDVKPRLHEYVGGILRSIDCPPIQVGGVEDHIHLLLRLNRTLTIAQTIEKIKTPSSKWMKVHVPD